MCSPPLFLVLSASSAPSISQSSYLTFPIWNFTRYIQCIFNSVCVYEMCVCVLFSANFSSRLFICFLFSVHVLNVLCTFHLIWACFSNIMCLMLQSMCVHVYALWLYKHFSLTLSLVLIPFLISLGNIILADLWIFNARPRARDVVCLPSDFSSFTPVKVYKLDSIGFIFHWWRIMYSIYKHIVQISKI